MRVLRGVVYIMKSRQNDDDAVADLVARQSVARVSSTMSSTQALGNHYFQQIGGGVKVKNQVLSCNTTVDFHHRPHRLKSC